MVKFKAVCGSYSTYIWAIDANVAWEKALSWVKENELQVKSLVVEEVE